eukprot:PhF_6_TR14536/c0_g1_i1/m.23069
MVQQTVVFRTIDTAWTIGGQWFTLTRASIVFSNSIGGGSPVSDLNQPKNDCICVQKKIFVITRRYLSLHTFLCYPPPKQNKKNTRRDVLSNSFVLFGEGGCA